MSPGQFMHSPLLAKQSTILCYAPFSVVTEQEQLFIFFTKISTKCVSQTPRRKCLWQYLVRDAFLLDDTDKHLPYEL